MTKINRKISEMGITKKQQRPMVSVRGYYINLVSDNKIQFEEEQSSTREQEGKLCEK